jgi:hypothetical protein
VLAEEVLSDRLINTHPFQSPRRINA